MHKLCLFLVTFFPFLSWAKTTVSVKGSVLDDDTNVELIGATIEILSSDNTPIMEAKADKRAIIGGELVQTSEFTMTVPKKTGKVIFKVSYPGFDTLYVDYNISSIGKREGQRELDPFYLHRKTVELHEVTVKASKVKFYHKGDTLVYNADAFQLAEGSMLDALIRQLPEVEIKDNGQIYVGGKYVESLLLNGKDFFKGQGKLMLDNLGAYTVKDIAVYDKRGERSEFLDRDVVGDQRYVMDVRLKKEYARSWIINMEGGYGSENRYLGRLFALGFTSRSRLGLYANVNNLNDSRRPGQTDSWTPDMLKAGVRQEKLAGLDYMLDSDNHASIFNGNVNFAHSILDNTTAVNSINFLPKGNNTQQSYTESRNRNYRISTENKYYMRHKWYDMSVLPSFSYFNYDNRLQRTSALLDGEFDMFDIETLRSIVTSPSKEYQSKLINTSILEQSEFGHTLNGGLKVSSTVKLPGVPDFLTIGADASIAADHAQKFNLWDINYFDRANTTNQQNQNEHLHQRQQNHPNHNYNYSSSIGYTFVATHLIDFSLAYAYKHSHSQKSSSLFLLENSQGLYTNYIEVFDPYNSYVSEENVHSQLIIPSANITHFFGESRLWIQLAAPMTFNHRSLKYKGCGADTTVVHNSFTPSAYDTFAKWRSANRRQEVTFQYILTPRDPAMIDFIDVTNTVDPLNLFKGNSGLKTQLTNEFTLSWRYSTSFHSINNKILALYDFTKNALVKGYAFNQVTGVRTYSTYNVDGNNHYGLQEYFSFAFGKQNRFSLSSSSMVDWVNSADMVGQDIKAMSKQMVRNRLISQTLRVDYTIAEQKIGLIASGLWRKSKSDDTKWVDFNSYDLKAGITGTFKLPANFGLTTDFTVFKRGGYSAPEKNKCDLVWNARLSYTVFKGKWIFMLDAFDMLHQLKNVSYIVNAQGRTETYSNVLPRYILFHAQYRLNIQPKKQ